MTEIAPIDARTHDQLASRHRTVKIVRGFLLDVHAHGVFIGVDAHDGDTVWIPRWNFDGLVRWYMGK